jgi:hypothetical protein
MRRRLSVCLLATVVTAACGGAAAAPTAPTIAPVPGASALATNYVNELLNTMQLNSINRDRLNWTDVRAQVAQRAAGAQTIQNLYPAISLALGLLDDHHSFYQAAGGGGVGNPLSPRCTAAAAGTPALPGDVGYVRIGSFSSSVAGADVAFADTIQEQIRARDAENLVGWIVDLRGNGGGNMWPMVAGVGPVLGEGVIGFFVTPTGSSSPWSYQGGAALNGSTPISRTTTLYLLLSRVAPKVAVLTDNLVASSGEAVAVAFRGRPNTRSFGGATCGLSTANSGFRLSDGATLQLTVSLMADRLGMRYGIPLAPDETVDGDGAVVQRAIGWLRSG